MKAHIGVAAQSGLTNTVEATTGKVRYAKVIEELIREADRAVFADKCYFRIRRRKKPAKRASSGEGGRTKLTLGRIYRPVRASVTESWGLSEPKSSIYFGFSNSSLGSVRPDTVESIKMVISWLQGLLWRIYIRSGNNFLLDFFKLIRNEIMAISSSGLFRRSLSQVTFWYGQSSLNFVDSIRSSNMFSSNP